MARKRELTWAEVERRKSQAEVFTRNVLEDDERADEIADESLRSYAGRRGFAIAINPHTRTNEMARTTSVTGMKRPELIERLRELEEENQALNDKLDSIIELAAADEEDDEEDDDEDE